MLPPLPVRTAALLVATVLGIGACSGEGAPWAPEESPGEESTTLSLSLGEAATLHGPEGLELRVSVDFIRQPVVPVGLSPETSTFLEVHLTVDNTGSVPFSGVLSEGADLTVEPGGPLLPFPTEMIPTEIALSGGADLGEPVTIPPDAPPLQGRVVFRVDPAKAVSTFSLNLEGGRETAVWAL